MLVVDNENNVFDVKELGKGVYVTNLYNHQHTNQVCSIGKEFDLDGTERDLTIEDVEQGLTIQLCEDNIIEDWRSYYDCKKLLPSSSTIAVGV